MSEPMPEPTDLPPATDPWPAPAAMPLVFMEGRSTLDGSFVSRINGVEVPAGLLDAVRKFTRSQTEELRQQQLRQQLAEREVTDLRAEVERLTVDHLAAVAAAADGSVDVEKLRGLLREALAGWRGAAECLPHEPGRQRARDEITRLREAGGLT